MLEDLLTSRSPFDYYVKFQCHGVQRKCPSALLLGGLAKDLAQPMEVNGYTYSYLHAVEGTWDRPAVLCKCLCYSSQGYL